MKQTAANGAGTACGIRRSASGGGGVAWRLERQRRGGENVAETGSGIKPENDLNRKSGSTGRNGGMKKLRIASGGITSRKHQRRKLNRNNGGVFVWRV